MAEKVKKKAIKKTLVAKRAAAAEISEKVSAPAEDAGRAVSEAEQTVNETVQAETEPAAEEFGTPSESRQERLSKHDLIIEIIRKIIFCIALGAFAYSATGLAVYGYSYYSSAKEYKEMKEEGGVIIETKSADETEAAEETETETDASGEIIDIKTVEKVPEINFSVDESYFKSVNSDYVCYLYIPGESDDDSLTYPVVLGTDNEHYLRYTYRNTENMGGSICMDFRTDRNNPLGTFNTVIWGHDRKDGSMFGYLLKYKDEAYGKKYPYIYIYMDGQVYVYKVFAFYQNSPYGVMYSPLSNAEDVINRAKEANTYSNTIDVTADDKVLTLYTCTEDATNRYILQAQLKDVYTP